MRPSALIATLAALMLAAAAPAWREDATRLYYDGALKLGWTNNLGDWIDADGVAQGIKPFARASLGKLAPGATVKLDVTRLVRAHGADIRLAAEGGPANFASREAESGAGAPVLRVTTAAGTRALTPTADVSIGTATVRSLGAGPTLSTKGGILLAFDQPADPAITRAELILTVVKIYQRPTLTVFRPVAAPPPPGTDTAATTERQAARERPAGAKRPAASNLDAEGLTPPARRALSQSPDRRIRPATPPRAGAARVLAEWRGAEVKARGETSRAGGVLTAHIEGTAQTAIQHVLHVPGHPTEAYLTVVLKLHDNWTAKGGKLPGLSNTGQGEATAGPCLVAGQPVMRGGWGGRKANGCRWSARTGFWGVRGAQVGAGTYFYATDPASVNGVVEYWSIPMPRARWFAYTQRVRLNTPGERDGELGYWLVADGPARGGRAVQARGNIAWRATDAPESAINEVWANVFCGGRDCGPAPWPRSSISLARLTVTDTLPDLARVQAEVDRLNAGG